jgi:hypothetical protein
MLLLHIATFALMATSAAAECINFLQQNGSCYEGRFYKGSDYLGMDPAFQSLMLTELQQPVYGFHMRNATKPKADLDAIIKTFFKCKNGHPGKVGQHCECGIKDIYHNGTMVGSTCFPAPCGNGNKTALQDLLSRADTNHTTATPGSCHEGTLYKGSDFLLMDPAFESVMLAQLQSAITNGHGPKGAKAGYASINKSFFKCAHGRPGELAHYCECGIKEIYTNGTITGSTCFPGPCDGAQISSGADSHSHSTASVLAVVGVAAVIFAAGLA